MPRIIADFNTLQVDPEKVLLGTVGTPNGDRLCTFHSGDRVILDGGDLEVEATLLFDDSLQAWFAIPDWKTQREIAA
jgi:murein endopeptidase